MFGGLLLPGGLSPALVEALNRKQAVGVEGILRLEAVEKEHAQRPRVFGVDLSPILALEQVLDGLIGASGDVHPVGLSGRLHARRDVDGLSPHIVVEFLLADDAGHHRSAVQADAHLPRLEPELDAVFVEAQKESADGERGQAGIDGMVHVRLWQAGRAHVGVSDGFQLLDIEARRDIVERGEEVVQRVHEGPRCHALRDLRTAHNIAEQDRCGGIVAGLGGLMIVNLLRDHGGQDVEHQAAALGLLRLQLLLRRLKRAQVASHLQLSDHLMREAAEDVALLEAQLPGLESTTQMLPKAYPWGLMRGAPQ